ncbi:hypothetical protein FHS15_004540 [Paenibacillus castaneae]|nr:hypothetical protein [Paenibacillus castaneae]
MFLSRRDSEAKEQEVPCSKQQRAYQDGGGLALFLFLFM